MSFTMPFTNRNKLQEPFKLWSKALWSEQCRENSPLRYGRGGHPGSIAREDPIVISINLVLIFSKSCSTLRATKLPSVVKSVQDSWLALGSSLRHLSFPSSLNSQQKKMMFVCCFVFFSSSLDPGVVFQCIFRGTISYNSHPLRVSVGSGNGGSCLSRAFLSSLIHSSERQWNMASVRHATPKFCENSFAGGKLRMSRTRLVRSHKTALHLSTS